MENVVTNFNGKLHSLIPSPCYERPFVCDGQPDQCTVIVIGKNPVTSLSRDWWSYWNDNSGFDLEKFQSVYESERIATQKSPVSNTRRRLNRLRENGLSCIETNVFRSEDKDSPSTGISNADLLKFFFDNIPTLKAVIAHGSVAIDFLRHQPVPKHIRVYTTRHFCLASYEELDKISQEILAF